MSCLISRKFSIDDKYEVQQIETIEDKELAYKISMNILNVEEHDHDDSYEIHVANGLGMQKYFFEIDVEGVDGGGKIPGDKVLSFKIMQTIFDLLSAVSFFTGRAGHYHPLIVCTRARSRPSSGRSLDDLVHSLVGFARIEIHENDQAHP